MTQLKNIKKNELLKAYFMHWQGFMPTFLKYFDRINPIFTTPVKFCKSFQSQKLHMFWILCDDSYAGQIWIKDNGETAYLARLFILSKYQNKGTAQTAIHLAEELFPNVNVWRLDTIKEEDKNCHLYEKLGYIPFGTEKIINKRMTIIEYEKKVGDRNV